MKLEFKNGGWQRIGEVRSESNPSKSYHVALNAAGHLGCSCPSWIHKPMLADGSKAPCKHIVSLLNETLDHNGFDCTLFGLTWLAKRIAANL